MLSSSSPYPIPEAPSLQDASLKSIVFQSVGTSVSGIIYFTISPVSMIVSQWSTVWAERSVCMNEMDRIVQSDTMSLGLRINDFFIIVSIKKVCSVFILEDKYMNIQ